MDQRYELATHGAEENHWWYVGRRSILATVVRSLPLAPPLRILDAGCGSGRNMAELASLGTVTGVEPAAASAAAARARGLGRVLQAGLEEELPLDDDEFDLALCLDVIEHLDDDRGALVQLRRVVRPGGRLVVTVPWYPRLWSQHDVVNQHRRRYTRASLLRAVSGAGWRCERLTHFNALLLPIAAAARMAERRSNTPRPGGSDLERTPALLNPVLRLPLLVEARVIGRGLDLPVGLSVLAVLA